MTKVTSDPAPLDAITYFRPLSWAERQQLAQRAVVRDFRRGAHVFEEGAPPAGLWVVMKGRIRLVRTSPSGREQVLHIEGPGATLAEIPMFDGGGYVATAVAAEPARLLFLSRDAVLGVCRRHPEVALGIIRVLRGPRSDLRRACRGSVAQGAHRTARWLSLGRVARGEKRRRSSWAGRG